MPAILFTATEEHNCERAYCPKGGTIKVGEMAVKTTGRRGGCGGSWNVTIYYHQECYQTKGVKR